MHSKVINGTEIKKTPWKNDIDALNNVTIIMT